MKLKLIVPVIFSLLATLPVQNLYAQQSTVIKQTKTHNVFKGALLSIWARFKSFSPHSKQTAKVDVVYTAGIRGAESTGTLIKPAWKDDLTQDKAFQEELASFGSAMTQLDNGNLKQASESLGNFISQYHSSTLKPNALFAEGMSYAGLGDNEKSKQVLTKFISEYPTHPLAKDAEVIVGQLQ